MRFPERCRSYNRSEGRTFCPLLSTGCALCRHFAPASGVGAFRNAPELAASAAVCWRPAVGFAVRATPAGQSAPSDVFINWSVRAIHSACRRRPPLQLPPRRAPAPRPAPRPPEGRQICVDAQTPSTVALNLILLDLTPTLGLLPPALRLA